MEASNLFAQMPSTPEPIIAQVRRDLDADCAAAVCARGIDLDGLAETSVLALWDSRVRVFVPVLALREARETLGVHGGMLPASEAESSHAIVDAIPLLGRDALTIDERDILAHDPRDVHFRRVERLI